MRRYLLVLATLTACKSHEAPPRPPPHDLSPKIEAQATADVADKHAAAQAASGKATVTRAWRCADAPQLAAGHSWVAVDVDLGTYPLEVDDVEVADADVDPSKSIAAVGDFKRLDPDGNLTALYGAHANDHRFLLYFDVPAKTKHVALLFAGERLTTHAADIADSGPTFDKPQRSVIRHFADGNRHVLVYEDFNQEDPPNTLTNHVRYAGGECAIRGVVPVDHALALAEPPLAHIVAHAFYAVDYACDKPPTRAWFDVQVPAGERLALPVATLEALEGRGPGITVVPASDPFTRVAARRDGLLLAIAPIAGAVQLVDPDGKEVGRLAGIHERVQQLGFTPDGKQVWLVEETGDVLVWDVTTHAQLAKRRLDAPPDLYSRPVMTSDGRALVVDHPWNKPGETQVAWSGQATVLGLPALTPRATLQIVSGNEGSISGLDVSPDGKRLVVCASTKAKSWARLAGLDGRAIATLPLDNVEADVCTFTADGRIVIGDANGTVSLFDAAGRKRSSLHGNDGGVYVFGRRADGSFFTGGADGKMLLWPLAGGKPQVVGEMKGPVREIETVDDLVISRGMYDLTVRDSRGKLVARLYAGPDQSDSMVVAHGLVAIAEPMIAAKTARVRIWHAPAKP